MSTAEIPEFVSVEDYLASEEMAATRNEYIDGWVRAMTGATNRHNRVKGNCPFVGMLHHPGATHADCYRDATHRKGISP